MRIIFTACIFLLALGLYGQEAGRVGELMKNEVTSNETQNRRSQEAIEKKGNVIGESKSRGRRQGNNPNTPDRNNFRWNYNYGNSEVFLRIPEIGEFTVHIGGQMIKNATGKFRFFDLRSGNLPISIFDNNHLIYRSRITVRNNSRTVLDFFSDYGWKRVGQFRI